MGANPSSFLHGTGMARRRLKLKHAAAERRLNMALTAALPFRFRSAMLFSLLGIERHTAVQPPPC
jgi:hypothetical protein